MDLKFELTREDVAHYNRYTISTSEIHKDARPTFLSLFLLGIILGFSITISDGQPLIYKTLIVKTIFAFIFSLVFAVIMMHCLGYYYKDYAKRLADAVGDKFYSGSQIMTFDNRGVHLESKHSTAFIEWPGIDHIDQDSHYFYVFTTRISGFFIPKRIFTSAGMADEFYDFISKHVEAYSHNNA